MNGRGPSWDGGCPSRDDSDSDLVIQLRRKARAYVVAGLGLVVGAGGTAGQEGQVPPPREDRPVVDLDRVPRPRADAVRAEGVVVIDGRLDDDAWALAPVIDDFTQQKPFAGRPSSERTEVRFLYDDENLYIGAELFDSDGEAPIIATLQRDPNTRDGDAFGITLDTFLDGKSAFAFFINPGGAVRDTQTTDDGRVNNAAWEAAYELRTRIHDRGWTVELAIPWSTLRFEGGRAEQVWGLNLLRRIRRKNEDATWAPMDRQWALYTMSRAGRLHGIDGVRPGRNLSVKPYALVGEPSGTLQSDADTELEGGVDLKFGITPGMTLDLTYNTDFSQVEVDQQQVNLTRFSLFFPEKREFFLENAGIFQFGDQGSWQQRNGATNRDFTLFHSRRIGLTPSGTPLPILGGGRVSGSAGPLSVGLLNMQTRSEGTFGAENFTVARARGEVAPGVDLGGIFVNRAVTSGSSVSNQSYGADLNIQAFNRYLLIQSYVAGSQGTDVRRRGRGYGDRGPPVCGLARPALGGGGDVPPLRRRLHTRHRLRPTSGNPPGVRHRGHPPPGVMARNPGAQPIRGAQLLRGPIRRAGNP